MLNAVSLLTFLTRSKARFQRIVFRRGKLQANPWQQTQNNFMMQCFADYKVQIGGVLHVGGHLGEEYDIYKTVGAKRVAFFEPVPSFFDAMARNLKGRKDVELIRKALGSKNEIRLIYVNKGSGESTSFLEPTTLYEGHFEEKQLPIEVATLDSVLPSLIDSHVFNLLVTDTQGFDLEVLKGATDTLKQIDYVYTEVSKGHYHNEPELEDFDALLVPLGFRRVSISLYGSWKGSDHWGDVFYIKNGERHL